MTAPLLEHMLPASTSHSPITVLVGLVILTQRELSRNCPQVKTCLVENIFPTPIAEKHVADNGKDTG